MMSVQITCPKCESSVHVYPATAAIEAICSICEHQIPLKFSEEHTQDVIHQCAVCERKDFYKQKDFNRKIGVALFILAAVLAIWTYGISLIALYLIDLFLFGKLGNVVVCYKCSTIYRNAKNLKEIPDFDHEMHDRIVYSDHDFKGKPLSH